MSEPTSRGGVKTLAIRLPDELHAQLVLIASLEGLSLTDTIRQAISELIERKRGDGDLAAQAAKALEEMEQETETRRQALQALLGPGGETGSQQATGDQPAPARGRPRRGEPTS
jgi:predicted DNA-binding protein